MDAEQNILIVEDEQLNVDTIVKLFDRIKEKSHINVLVAKTGEKALSILKIKEVDL